MRKALMGKELSADGESGQRIELESAWLLHTYTVPEHNIIFISLE
jgi:hypothetical protein